MEHLVGKQVTTPSGYEGTILAFVTDLNGEEIAVVHWTRANGSPRNFTDTTALDDLMVSLKDTL